MIHHHKMGTIRTDTYGVTIEHDALGDIADIIADLEDEIVDKACMKYHRDQHYGNMKGDMQEYVYYITQDEDSIAYHAYSSGVKVGDRLAAVYVKVMWTTSRM